MRIRHTIDAPVLEEKKNRLRDNRWIPIVVAVGATLIAVRVCSKAPQITINNYDRPIEVS